MFLKTYGMSFLEEGVDGKGQKGTREWGKNVLFIGTSLANAPFSDDYRQREETTVAIRKRIAADSILCVAVEHAAGFRHFSSNLASCPFCVSASKARLMGSRRWDPVFIP